MQHISTLLAVRRIGPILYAENANGHDDHLSANGHDDHLSANGQDDHSSANGHDHYLSANRHDHYLSANGHDDHLSANGHDDHLSDFQPCEVAPISAMHNNRINTAAAMMQASAGSRVQLLRITQNLTTFLATWPFITPAAAI